MWVGFRVYGVWGLGCRVYGVEGLGFGLRFKV